jgi:hypothetical protein
VKPGVLQAATQHTISTHSHLLAAWQWHSFLAQHTFHCKVKLAALQCCCAAVCCDPDADAFPRLVGLAHFSVGYVFTYAAFLLASTSENLVKIFFSAK